MSETFQFIVQEGRHNEADALYLPYCTRTLRLEVINRAGRALKLWLRPESTPDEFPEHVIHGYGDDDPSEVFAVPYDASLLRRDFRKVHSVERAFDLEVAAVWRRNPVPQR